MKLIPTLFFAGVTTLALSGCAVFKLAGYAMRPNTPELTDGETITLPALQQPVAILQRSDGLWAIDAQNEHDMYVATGYLQARDRMFQLDLFRHLARGEVAKLVGRVPFGDASSVEMDALNRALDFAGDAQKLWQATSPKEQAALTAFADGVNAWIAHDRPTLEHRLLGHSPASWTAQDSLTIYRFVMYGLSGNWNVEARRLLLACDIGLDKLEQVWPTDLYMGEDLLPAESKGTGSGSAAPAVVAEIATDLVNLCPAASETPVHAAAPGDSAVAAALALYQTGFYASNNWIVSSSHTASGKSILSNDPHLPLLSPPIVWGVHQRTGQQQYVGFTLPALHRPVFGHNFKVAFGATVNYMDRQDLAIHKPRAADGSPAPSASATHYELDGTTVAFGTRHLTIEVRGEEATTVTVRTTAQGFILNDVDSLWARYLPLVEIRQTPVGEARDADAARALNEAQHVADFESAIALMDSGCTNWVAADAEHISYRSPCMVPIRQGWSGTFPVAGWLSKYNWTNYMAKDQLPKVNDPAQGYFATANATMAPATAWPTTLWGDTASPQRTLRAGTRLRAEFAHGTTALTAAKSASIQHDVHEAPWIALNLPQSPLCTAPRATDADLRDLLCRWDGEFRTDSVAASLYILWQNAVVDAALADALPAGADTEYWHWLQKTPKFETVVAWLLAQPATAPVWDDLRTAQLETRDDIFAAAFDPAVADARARWGSKISRWKWGVAHPLTMRHPFASKDGLAGAVFNPPSVAGLGGPETLYKNQFMRGDRERLEVTVGPVVRFTVDMAAPERASYSMAGGESGWPKSPRFGNLLNDWRWGIERPLTPTDSTSAIRATLHP